MGSGRHKYDVRINPSFVPVGCSEMSTRGFPSEEAAMQAIFEHEDQRGHDECCEPEFVGFVVKCKVCKRRVDGGEPLPTHAIGVRTAKEHEASEEHQSRIGSKRRESDLLDRALGL